METLPLELWWKIFDELFEKNPLDLYRLRAVCNKWKTCIDQYLPSLYKKWHDACIRDIPEDCINNIVTTEFPMAAFPWQESYWKTTQLPRIPREIHRAWTSMSHLVGGKYEVLKIPSTIIASPQYERFYGAEYVDQCPHDAIYAMNDKYVAIRHECVEETFNTCIYELTDLTRPIRKYSFKCLQMDFYTVGKREFIVVNAVLGVRNKYSVKSSGYGIFDDVYMSEFLKNDTLLHTQLFYHQYAIIHNECFSFEGLHFEHYLLSSDNRLEKNQKVTVPKDSTLSRKAEILGLCIEGMQLLVMIMSTDCIREWFFKYNISRDPSGNLNFCPDETNFIQLEKHTDSPLTLERITSGNLSTNIWFYLKHNQFMAWLRKTFDNNDVNAKIICGNHLIAGTKNGKIFILHQAADEILKDFVDYKFTGKFTEINLNAVGIRQHVMPIGIKYSMRQRHYRHQSRFSCGCVATLDS